MGKMLMPLFIFYIFHTVCTVLYICYSYNLEGRVLFLLSCNINILYWATEACLVQFRHCNLLETNNYSTLFFTHVILTFSFFPT